MDKIERFRLQSQNSYSEYQKKFDDDWDSPEEEEKVVKDHSWEIKVNHDVPKADWDHSDDDDEEEADVYARRSPGPGDADWELGQALRMPANKIEHLTQAQFKRRFWQVQAQKEEEKLESMTPRKRREEVEAILTEIQALKKQVQSCLDKVGILGNRVAYLICRD